MRIIGLFVYGLMRFSGLLVYWFTCLLVYEVLWSRDTFCFEIHRCNSTLLIFRNRTLSFWHVSISVILFIVFKSVSVFIGKAAGMLPCTDICRAFYMVSRERRRIQFFPVTDVLIILAQLKMFMKP